MSINRIKGMLTLIQDKYGNQIQQEETQDIRNGLASIVQLEDALSLFQLSNSEHPLATFTPYISEETVE